MVNWLLELGYIPSFCTACYREGRTGDRFMTACARAGQIANCCQPNALMTLKEYLEDYASPETKAKGEKMIADTIPLIPNEKVRRLHRGAPGGGHRRGQARFSVLRPGRPPPSMAPGTEHETASYKRSAIP